ncbi:MAG: ABC transporter ATP-binding protein [Clostridiales bacterium]|nr:ABC transporter ATP-binding protein [Clostridiales bacterium]
MHKQRYRLMTTLLRRNARIFTLAFILTAMTSFIQFLTPALLAEVMDHYLGTAPSRLPNFVNSSIDRLFGPGFLANNLWAFGFALVMVSLLSGAFSFFRGKLTAEGSENAARYLRESLYDHIQKLPFNYHVSVETGDLLQRCTSDINTIRRFLSQQVIAMLQAFLMIIFALSLMLPISVKVTLLSLSITPIIFLFSMLFFKLVIKAFRETDESEAAMSTVLQENLTGVRVVRAFGQAQNEIKKFDEVSFDLRKRGYQVANLEALYWALSGAMGFVQIVISLIVCIIEAQRGNISLGDLIIFTGYTGMLTWPIRQLGRILTESGKSMVALERINEVLKTKAEPEQTIALTPPLDGNIVFDHVSFHYEKGRDVLKDISFTAKAGQSIAILGPTGSGKSSLIYLMQQLYKPSSGSITIGGTLIENIDRSYLRRRIGLVLQDSFLYSKTIRENIAIAVRDADQSDIDRATKAASAYDFIQKSEKGFDTIVGERGVTLSGGQKQRVAIARTIMKDNDILIFDDSLSAVDTKTDAQIREAILSGDNKVTTFIISHRISTLSRADTILVLEDGMITQSGTHEQLIAQPGLYAKINRIQSGLEDSLSAAESEVN